MKEILIRPGKVKGTLNKVPNKSVISVNGKVIPFKEIQIKQTADSPLEITLVTFADCIKFDLKDQLIKIQVVKK